MKNTIKEKLSAIAKFAILGICLLCFASCSDSSDGDKTTGGATEETQGFAITDKVVAGVSQKGPFVNGSSVHLYGLDSETLGQSGSVFTGKIASDRGDFKVLGVNLTSQYALLEANGYYRNEVTGEKSKSPIMLYAITDLSDRENVNVNLLTHLEYERVLKLVSDSVNVRDAKKIAEEEILKNFYVNLYVESFEDLNIFNGGEGDAVLLAISVLLQGDRSEADLSELLANYAMDIETDGRWDDDQMKSSIADWSEAKFFEDRYGSIRNNIIGWKFGDVPEFEKYAMNFWWQNYGLGSCTGNRLGEVKKNQDSLSVNKDVFYICKNLLWERATDTEKDTYLWEKGNDGDVKTGSVIASNWYVYDESEIVWRQATNELDYTNGLGGCTVNRAGVLAVGSRNIKYLCYDKSWRKFSYGVCDAELEGRFAGVSSGNDSLLQCNNGRWEKINGCTAEKEGYCYDQYFICHDGKWLGDWRCNEMGPCKKIGKKKEYGGEYFVCDDIDWKKISSVVYHYGECTADNAGEKQKLENEYYICADNEWKNISEVAYEYGECAGSLNNTAVHLGDKYNEGFYTCRNDKWSESSFVDYELGVCSSKKYGEREKLEKTCFLDMYGRGGCSFNDDYYSEYLSPDYSIQRVDGMVATLFRGYFICKNDEWQKTSEPVYEFGECTGDNAGEKHLLGSSYYICKDKEWQKTREPVDEFGECTGDNAGEKHPLGSSYYICKDKEWLAITEEEYTLGFCTAEIEEKMDQYSGRYFICLDQEWKSISKETFDLGPCTKDIEGIHNDMGKDYVCYNRIWFAELSYEFPKEYLFNPSVEYKTFTDARDGNVYKYVTIGGREWMAENLQIENSNNNRLNKCYVDEALLGYHGSGCKYAGRVYTWTSATNLPERYARSSYGSDEWLQGMCPDGWKIPSAKDWENLYAAVEKILSAKDWENLYAAGEKDPSALMSRTLMSRTGWIFATTDASGFSAVPHKVTSLEDDELDLYGTGIWSASDRLYGTMFWSATESNRSIAAEAWCFGCADLRSAGLLEVDKKMMLYVRCIKN